MFSLTAVLRDNRFLEQVNLSWNSLEDHYSEIFDENSAFYPRTGAIINRPTRSKRKKKGEPTEPKLLAVFNICQFIKYNNNLLHLDLSYMGMNAE